MPTPAFVFDAPPVVYWNSNPYGLAFSPDGSMLAVGSGGWYGGGGLSLVDVASGKDTTLRFVTGPHADGVPVATFDCGEVPLTVSGVAFDGSGEHLAACTWSSSQHEGPTLLFRVAEGSIEHRSTFVVRERDPIFDRCPTGLCFMDGHLYVRNNARRLEDVLSSFPMPPAVDTNVPTAYRSHARVARVGRELITGGGGSLKLGGWSIVEGTYESFKATSGMVVGPPARGVPAPGARITAVLARPGGMLITGGLGGEVIAWERDEDWRSVRWLRRETKRDAPIGGAWATYRPESVVGLCALEDGRFFSVDASGEVLEWRDDGIIAKHELPRPGTARCIAVHPQTPRGPLLAVGLKVEGKERRGYVACLPIE